MILCFIYQVYLFLFLTICTNAQLNTPTIGQQTEALSLSANVALEDDIQFLFKWPGNLPTLDENPQQDSETLDILTNKNEKFKCSIPILKQDNLDGDINDESLTHKDKVDEAPIQISNLLSPLYTKKLCSYRIESYWIYELCHGQYVKQYHETKSAGKRLVTEEYFLGYYHQTKQEPDYFKQNDNKLSPNIHMRNLNGEKVPMFAVKYTDGTMCEILKNTPREITVFYACDELGNDNIAGFEEISSCMYEMIVITKLICSHPAFKIPEKVYPTISCYSVDNSPQIPSNLIEIENEQKLETNDKNKVKMTDKFGDTFIIHYKTIDDNNEQTTQDEPETINLNENQQQNPPQQQQNQAPTQQQSFVSDEAQKEMIKSFLNGAQCLNGGTGWWKYEICFGKHVTQYHEDEKTKKRTNILLGTWNPQNHLEWLNKNPNKRPLKNKQERPSISLLYSDGSKCDETQKNRFVEVRFKCIRNKINAGAISLYLIEPNLCEYTLGIESPWLCDYIESADMNSLTSNPTPRPSNAEEPKANKEKPSLP